MAVPLHSCRRLNDPNTGLDSRIIGSGTHLGYGTNTFIDVDQGYSGNPLALVPYRPKAAPKSFMYVGDSSRMRKVSTAGALHTIGYHAPDTAPGVALSNVPAYKVVDEFDAVGSWTKDGTNVTANPTLISRSPGGASGSTTTISQILYDSGTTGWCSIQLASMVGVGKGERITFVTSAETATVQDVFAGLSGTTAATIAAILYDSGTSGPCSIVLSDPIDQVQINSFLRNTTVGENIRVVGRIPNPDGTYSIRASTVATFAATNAIEVRPSIRIYCVNNHAVAETVKNDAVTFSTTAIGNGYIRLTGLTLDLSKIISGVATQPDDLMHIGLRVDHPELISEIKVMLDVDSASNDFLHNYYYRSIRPSDLTSSAQSTSPLVTSASTILTRTVLDSPAGTPLPESQQTTPPPDIVGNINDSSLNNLGTLPGVGPAGSAGTSLGGPTGLSSRTGESNLLSIYLNNGITTPANAPTVQSQQLETGNAQWVDVQFSISDLIRVGTDDSRTLQNVAALQILVMVTGVVSAGVGPVIAVDSWWVGGGYGPNTEDVTASPYYYRYRAREQSTNVASNWSPATRLAMDAHRQSIVVTPTQYAAPSGTSLATTDFVLDIERFGGQLADWHYVGTTTNVASPSFLDTFPDDIVAGQPIIGQDNYQPWPILGLPVTGTTGIVAGTTVQNTGPGFVLSWAPGTRIIINNQPYTIYRVISTTLLELVESAGAQSGVVFKVNEPTILAQPLPCLWEWDGVLFACGDTINGGRLYYSNPDSETTTPTNYLDLTPPSEPLMNGLQYNIRSYVFSSENFIQIIKTGDPDNPYRHEHIPNGKGLFSRWGLTREPAPIIAFLTRDGICMTTGGSPTSLTDADLYDLFPNEGNLGVNVNGIIAPAMIAANAPFLRLAYYDDYLYFDYPDAQANIRTLLLALDLGAAVRGEAPGGWLYDVFTPNIAFHYGEEGPGIHDLLLGGVDGILYQYGGNSDNGIPIRVEFTTPSRDQGDPRSLKFYGDVMLDSNTATLDIMATPYFNNDASPGPTLTYSTPSRAQTVIPTADGAWQTAQNISLFVTCAVFDARRPFWYIWEPRWTFESAEISALSWNISPSALGNKNFKHIGLCKVTHVSSVDFTITFTVDGVAMTPITISNSGGIYQQTIFRTPVYKGKIFQIFIQTSDGSTTLRLDPRDTFFQVKEWGQDIAYEEKRIFADYAMIEG